MVTTSSDWFHKQLLVPSEILGNLQLFWRGWICLTIVQGLCQGFISFKRNMTKWALKVWQLARRNGMNVGLNWEAEWFLERDETTSW